MGYPSAARLAEAFPDVDPEVLRGLMSGAIDVEENAESFPKTIRWLHQMYNRPSNNEIALHAIDELLGTYGVEGWADPSNFQYGVSYANTGDSYATTIILKTDWHGDHWILSSWGDLVEQMEADGEEVP